MSFDAIGLPAEMLAAVKACGFQNLTPIQQKAIPVIRKGRDVLASAHTGTGKTAAFALPIIQSLLSSSSTGGQLKALVLTPTRELAKQVAENFTAFSQNSAVTTGVVYGGVSIKPQLTMLKQGVDILVATPGRLLELINEFQLNLSQLSFLVLDEADRMLDMGFLADIERLLPRIPPRRQTLLFSATYSHKVRQLAKQLLSNPVVIEVAKQNTTAGKVKQEVYWVQEARKRELLSELIGVNNWQQVLVFAGTRESANDLAKELKLDGIKTVLCHGDRSQGARQKALEAFVSGDARVMVATDVAARGLDIVSLPHVINFHLPFLAEDYVHRVGRTGRAGKVGHAVSLVSPKDERFLADIEKLVGRRFERIVQPGYEFDPRSEPKQTQLKPENAKNRYQTTRDKNRRVAAKQQARKSTSTRKK